jgi:PAS domain S-box-containing protein
MSTGKKIEELLSEIEELRLRVEESKQTIQAIQKGEVDAVYVDGPFGEQVYTLKSVDHTYKQIVEEMNQGSFKLDEEGIILYGNRRLEELLKKPLERVIGSSIYDYVEKKDQQLLEALIHKGQETRTSGEITFKSLEGDVLPSYLAINPLIVDEDEEDVKVLSVMLTDLTEQKQHEDIVKSERFSRSILEQAGRAIVVCDENGKIIRANEMAHQLSNTNPLLKPFNEVFPLIPIAHYPSFNDKPKYKEPFPILNVLNGEIHLEQEVSYILPPHKDKLFLMITTTPLKLEGDKKSGVIITLEDITERKKAEKTLTKRTVELTNANVLLKVEIKERERLGIIIQDNVRRLDLALEAASMGAWDLDIENDTTIRTLEHDQIFGYDSFLPEWGAKIFFEHIIPEDREYAQQRFDKAYETNKLFLQYRIIRADNKQVRWIETYGNLYRNEKNVPIRMLGVVVDITERKETEDQLLKVIDEKEMLLREIHHRVKNNMQIISSLLHLESSKVFDKRDAEFFTTVQDRIKSMGLIHGNLYQSEDISSIKFKEYVDNLTYQLFITHAASSNIKLVTDIMDITLNMETAIPLGLIVNELVSNSLKYAFPDFKGEMFISIHSKGEEFELIIKDNGVGIPKDLDLQKSKGLGLQLVNSLVEQLEGTIELDKNHGTKYKITFKELKYKKRIN